MVKFRPKTRTNNKPATAPGTNKLRWYRTGMPGSPTYPQPRWNQSSPKPQSCVQVDHPRLPCELNNWSHLEDWGGTAPPGQTVQKKLHCQPKSGQTVDLQIMIYYVWLRFWSNVSSWPMGSKQKKHVCFAPGLPKSLKRHWRPKHHWIRNFQ